MKKRGVIILFALLLVLAGSLRGAEQLLCEFSPESLVIGERDFHIGYAGLPRLTINGNFSLPVQTLYIEGEHPSALSDCRFTTGEQDTLGIVPAEYVVFDDRVTSAEDREIISPQRQSSRLSSVVYDITPFERGGRTITAVTILPVTLTDDNHLVFHRSVSITSSDLNVIVYDASSMIEEMTSPSAGIEYRLAGKSTGNAGIPLGIEYVIITTEALAPAFEELANFRNGLGVTTSIAILDSICRHFPGVDDAEKIRRYLAEFYAGGGRYVLFGGDDVTVPARYVYFYDTDSPPDDAYYFMPSDLYYADLDGDWDADGDDIWGEPTHDSPDLNPELVVGRLPVRTPEAVQNYISKLIRYMTDPGDGDFAYLSRAMFFSSDQMRDYPAEGQHTVIAEELPVSVYVDTVLGVEMPTGGDPNPTNPGGVVGIDRLSEGFGFVHIIAHGRTDGYIVKSANYGDWPASLILSMPQTGGHGSVLDLDENSKTSLYYSLACNNGAYDLDTSDGQSGNWSLVETLISRRDAGAVGMVAYSRWGWVYSSYLLQEAFTGHLYGAAEGSPARAMYYSWVDCPYYRDLIYGQNYFGDPALKIHLTPPEKLEITVAELDGTYSIAVTGSNRPVPGAAITVGLDGTVLEQGVSDESGRYVISTELDDDVGYAIGVVRDGYTAVWETYVPSCVLDVDDDPGTLPLTFSLQQNHPNPFNPLTIIEYSLAERCDVRLDVYNILGQSVAAFVLTDRPTGQHSIIFDGRDMHGNELPSGIYFYRLKAGEFIKTRKMALIR